MIWYRGGEVAQRIEIDWPTCTVADCVGIRLPEGKRCLAHCGDSERVGVLNAITETGEIDARGVVFSKDLLEAVLVAAPRSAYDGPFIKTCRLEGARFDHAGFKGVTFGGEVWFDGAEFLGTAEFSGVTFGGVAGFQDVRFNGVAEFRTATFTTVAAFGAAVFSADAWFAGATFEGVAGFDGTRFSGVAGFRDAIFCSAAWFGGAIFDGNAGFGNALFGDDAWFSKATFNAVAGFGGVKFGRDAWFDNSTFGENVWFGGAIFGGDGRFDSATFHGDFLLDEVTFRKRAEFNGARFEQATRFGPMLVYRGLVLDDARFDQQVRIEASAAVLSCRRARFPAGVELRLRWTQVVLDDTDLSQPSTLGVLSDLGNDLAVFEDRAVRLWRRFVRLVDRLEPEEPGRRRVSSLPREREVSEIPQVLSLEGANVAGLALNGVTLTDCRFAGAHNLDKLRLEDNVTLTTAPTRLGRFSWDWRHVIAEERAWRAGRSRRWQAPVWPQWLVFRSRVSDPEVPDPGQIAALYRALRKGREDNKDEPGAADFYYGEMEMRRHARRSADSSVAGSSRGWAERSLLTAYWLISGYGLRAWRALAWLLGVVAVFTLLFHWYGFRESAQPDSYWQSLLATLETALSLEDKNAGLTGWGRLLRVLLRIIGPLLLGLAVLALRGRVKR
jgi:uncharacterized protein YjbI with pentapeptide repeats